MSNHKDPKEKKDKKVFLCHIHIIVLVDVDVQFCLDKMVSIRNTSAILFFRHQPPQLLLVKPGRLKPNWKREDNARRGRSSCDRRLLEPTTRTAQTPSAFVSVFRMYKAGPFSMTFVKPHCIRNARNIRSWKNWQWLNVGVCCYHFSSTSHCDLQFWTLQ